MFMSLELANTSKDQPWGGVYSQDYNLSADRVALALCFKFTEQLPYGCDPSSCHILNSYQGHLPMKTLGQPVVILGFLFILIHAVFGQNGMYVTQTCIQPLKFVYHIDS